VIKYTVGTKFAYFTINYTVCLLYLTFVICVNLRVGITGKMTNTKIKTKIGKTETKLN